MKKLKFIHLLVLTIFVNILLFNINTYAQNYEITSNTTSGMCIFDETQNTYIINTTNPKKQKEYNYILYLEIHDLKSLNKSNYSLKDENGYRKDTMKKSGSIYVNTNSTSFINEINLNSSDFPAGIYKFDFPAGSGLKICDPGIKRIINYNNIVKKTLNGKRHEPANLNDFPENIDGKRSIKLNLPYTKFDLPYKYIVRLKDPDTCPVKNKSDNETESICYIGPKDYKGVVDFLSALPPNDEYPIPDVEWGDTNKKLEYELIIYFECAFNSICALSNTDSITMFKSNSSKNRYLSEQTIKNISNQGIEACKGDLNCINCIARKVNGEIPNQTYSKFQSIADAASVSNTEIAYTNNIYTAIGCVDTSQDGIITRLIQIALGITGLILVIRLGEAVFLIQTADDPEKKKEGLQKIMTVFGALLIIAFSGLGLRFLGVNVFKVFSPGTIEIETRP